MDISQLTPDEKNILESVYGRQLQGVGYTPRNLEAIEELTPQEQKFFSGKNFMSAHFFVQTIYKVKGVVNPLKFTITVNRMLNDKENLRANFCNLGTRTVKVIHPAGSVKPEILFRNLAHVKRDKLNDEIEKNFMAEMRREINLEQDPLIHFVVYKTDVDEFAVIVTLAQIIFNDFNSEEFFCNLSDIPAEFKPKKISEALPPKNNDLIRKYWAKLFENAPPPAALPYEKKSDKPYRQRIFQANFPADLVSDLMAYAQSNRMMLMAILQSAWGFMLQLTNKRSDCLFCQILPVENFSLNVVPVRLTIDDDSLSVERIIRSQFRQLVISQPYSISDWTALDELTVQEKLFEHLIGFKEFTANELSYANYPNTPAEPLGKIIFQATWDVQDMKFGAYFRYANKNLLVGFIYDDEQFLEGGVEKIYELYLIILQQIVVDWGAKFSEFTKNLAERLKTQAEAETAPKEDTRKKFINFLSQLPILQGRHGGNLKFFENKSKIITLYEGDRISGDMIRNNFIFVADGILSRNVDTGDGWYNTLDIIEKNCFVNPTMLLEKQRFTLSATVLSERADLLLIPYDVMIETIRKSPDVALSVINYALEQLERYQILWLQS